ncbi:extracellular solute-binding protein [bacterium]|nr:extracellular solute-binding protein [bacterium]MDY2885756.1 extracellular solute-binding protein [Bariatricus sp.]
MNTKAEIQVALEKMGAAFEEKSGVHVEVMPVTDGDSPYTKMVSLYNSGNPPTLAILDTTDVIALAEEKAADLTEEPWTAEAEEYLTRINGKVYSFPLCIEGRGLIYNKKVIEGALGEEFDPKSVTTLDEFVGLLDRLVDAGIEKPVSLAKEDWSLGAHHLQYIYETYDGTSEGAAKIIEELKNGDLKVESYDRVYGLLDMFDVLKKYNVAKGDPLGADYDEMAIDLADGKTAFWFNGNWAWPNLEEAGAETEDEYGFLPYFMNNDPDDFVNCRIQASPSKQVMNDHWSILGSAMQKYLAGRSDREELIESIQDYWDEQE